MRRAVEFYQKLRFELFYGGGDSTFSSLRAGEAVVNLATASAYERGWWGRTIFRVEDVDAYHGELVVNGLVAESPRDAPWGERFFHINDPDGHELSLAEVLEEGQVKSSGTFFRNLTLLLLCISQLTNRSMNHYHIT